MRRRAIKTGFPTAVSERETSYRQCRGLNRTAHAILVGTKYDIFITLPPEEREAIDRDARRFARAMATMSRSAGRASSGPGAIMMISMLSCGAPGGGAR